MRRAILEKRFDQFAELTMKDSNSLHACCQDTYPPLCYLNDTSRAIMELVHHINEDHMRPIVIHPHVLINCLLIEGHREIKGFLRNYAIVSLYN